MSIVLVLAPTAALAQQSWRIVLPEQRRIEVRDPSVLPSVPIPPIPPPETVTYQPPNVPVWNLSLDEAIRIALVNTEVVRILAGLSATGSGQTIYDPAIANVQVDEAQGVFDPTLEASNLFNRFDTPAGVFDPTDPAMPPTRSIIRGTTSSDYDLRAGAAKRTVTGGTLRLGVNTNPTRNRTDFLPLNPFNRSSVEMSYVQPLLQGAGARVNRAPIVLARINTERSYFQFKDSVQEMVRGVIDAYWQLVFARTDVWAREQQEKQGEFAVGLAEAQLETGRGDFGNVAQARTALAGFRQALNSSRANLLNREAVLANMLRLPPAGVGKIVPMTELTKLKFDFDWPAILAIAEEQRPEIVEFKLILEADQQLLVQAQNQALPRVDASMLYRWNGLSGRMPSGASVAASGSDFADWTLGVSFSVPLGLRAERASLRRQQISIARDRAVLQQSIHSASHILAANLRNLHQFYSDYLLATQLRKAARENLDVQFQQFRVGLEGAIFLNVLTAITSWGNAVSSQALALSQYNTELANLERQTGTILETHGIRFLEERFASLGPLGRALPARSYPRAMPVGPNAARYPVSDRPAEQALNLEPPVPGGQRDLDGADNVIPPNGRNQVPSPFEIVPPGRTDPQPQGNRPVPGPSLRIRG